MGQAMIMRRGGGAGSPFPSFTYTGTYQFIDDENRNWRIKFLTSGTLTFTKIKGSIDLFLVGGGGCGLFNRGGGGGYTKTQKSIIVVPGESYPIIVGAGSSSPSSVGGVSSAFEQSANGGQSQNTTYASSGGSGGACSYNSHGASNGANGPGASGNFGIGQGSTTREFGDVTGDLYAGGGASSSSTSATYNGGEGGGGSIVNGYAHDGLVNTGGGGAGGGAGYNPPLRAQGNGGSGIVIIRNKR